MSLFRAQDRIRPSRIKTNLVFRKVCGEVFSNTNHHWNSLFVKSRVIARSTLRYTGQVFGTGPLQQLLIPEYYEGVTRELGVTRDLGVTR